MPDTLYTHDLLAPCWSCGKLFPFELLKDMTFDTMECTFTLCLECYEETLNQGEQA